ncbi:thioredoxin family protein [Thiobacillus sp.]|uniref:DUF1223 domain-containing protein n=1 Tax=Thiobacillus sp. TaxID=924 RepID=UPI0025DAECEC|nr:DUF1223 domain-containing protein [Thiobacillus sp.]MBT9539112.1 DUF1223 domain-containing protein [Thiobacillus sp.]
MRVFILLCALLAPTVHAAACSAVSGDTRNRLLELYTSEGCSSCPPADRWLSQLPANSGVVPLAFHVDYWDRLGWRDPFAQAAFGQRQRARNSGPGWVYTPQVMLDGEDFRSWQGGLPARLRAPATVSLSLEINQTPAVIEAQVESRFVSSGAARNAQVYLALYENRLSSRITAGENAQRTLQHDYVVRQLVGPLDPQRARYRFAVAPGWQLANLGVTAFVLDAQGKTMQALMRPACP